MGVLSMPTAFDRIRQKDEGADLAVAALRPLQRRHHLTGHACPFCKADLRQPRALA